MHGRRRQLRVQVWSWLHWTTLWNRSVNWCVAHRPNKLTYYSLVLHIIVWELDKCTKPRKWSQMHKVSKSRILYLWHTCRCYRFCCYISSSPDVCASNPCQNGGTCTRTRSSAGAAGYTCTCAQDLGYSGTNCEIGESEIRIVKKIFLTIFSTTWLIIISQLARLFLKIFGTNVRQTVRALVLTTPMKCIVSQQRLAVFPIRARTVESVRRLDRRASGVTAMARALLALIAMKVGCSSSMKAYVRSRHVFCLFIVSSTIPLQKACLDIKAILFCFVIFSGTVLSSYIASENALVPIVRSL